MSGDYTAFFRRATGHAPYPYQRRLAEGEWPDIVEVPTGLGKTAGVTVAWLWKRLHGDVGTPRRLLWCLPMRVLVEQTARTARQWIHRLEDDLRGAGLEPPVVHVVMGGETDADWALTPEAPTVIVGTQDMLLSRALMRGYGMSRFQWPIHFALLHNDALWVYDEVQLMGPALATTAQLDAFRRTTSLGRPSKTLWMSATLHRDWLDTVDLRPHLPSLRVLRIGPEDETSAGDRLSAAKRLHPPPLTLGRDNKGRYVDELAALIREQHQRGTQTLVVVNRVTRAQALYRALAASRDHPRVLLLHARFRPAERSRIEDALREESEGGRIVVATQAIEAGVDVSSAVLFTELAPWPSLVQRFGRCNRYGEAEEGARVFWIDIAENSGEAAPYEVSTLTEARENLEGLVSAAPRDLPPVASAAPSGMVLRRKDFLELFDTEPDLSGFDLDVSQYIRDSGLPQVRVFWREVGEDPGEEAQPDRDELCPASLGQMAAYLKRAPRKRSGGTGRRRWWIWDSLAATWVPGRGDRPRPTSSILLDAADGGYSLDVGFDPEERGAAPVWKAQSRGNTHAAFDGDPGSAVGRFVSLSEHTQHVMQEVDRLAGALELVPEDSVTLRTAALWHDVGKAHPAFQTALRDYGASPEEGLPAAVGTDVWAKSPGSGRLDYRIETPEGSEKRRYFRHELASVLAWLANAEPPDDRVAYLIAAHHGKLRLALKALPDERPAPDGARFARGVWEGDELPPIELPELYVPPTMLRLEVMELGWGRDGPSWTERTRNLLATEGPFRLAWIEALLRVADRRASAAEEGAAP